MQFADANSAAGHLLRHLHDSRALRTNPLVAHLFAEQEKRGEAPAAALARVHGVVLTTARHVFEGDGSAGRMSMHRKRQLEIVVRCDVRGEPHATVQTELGLGTRQFDRERRRARTQLASALEALVPAALAERGKTPDAHGLHIAAIRAARIHGDDALALQLVRDQLDDAAETSRHVELLATLVEIQAHAGEFADARLHVERANALDAQDDASRARVLQAEAQLASSEGRYAASARLCDAALGLYDRIPKPRDAGCEEQMVLAMQLSCVAKHGIGAYEEALAALRDARAIVDRRNDLPVYLTVRTLELLGNCQMLMPGAQAMAASHLLEARAVAQRNGLVREAVTCTLYLATMNGSQDDPERPLAIGRDALNVARKVFGRAAYAWHCLTFCSREMSAGCYENVVRLARTARACNDSAVCVSTANMLEAEALLHLGDAEQAHALALSAIDTFRKSESSRYLGTTLRIASEAAFRLGRSEYARYAIKEALALLERYGHPLSPASTERVSDSIDGTRSG